MTNRPAEELEAGRRFYETLIPGLDASHFGPMWHLVTMGHLILADLDRLAAGHGLSMADIHLLGTLRIERERPYRAVDLARSLFVTPAVLTARIRRLAACGFVVREPDISDRRTAHLSMTAKGNGVVEAVIAEIAENSNFVRALRRLEPDDRKALGQLLGALHGELDRILPCT
ncbi:MAG: hypothetical protein NVS3B5_00370 [Sphingomicrobium sp.]